MRIIGGNLRGRRIAAPPGKGTRPMLDRVREAMFSTLTPWLPGARVLDLFAGTGSLGLEALSRGATHARMVEKARHVAELLRDNVASLGLEDRTIVVEDDALAPRCWIDGPGFDVVFLDPPYPFLEEPDRRRAVFGALASLVAEHLAPEGVLVFHSPKRVVTRRDFPPGTACAERRYGTNMLWYVQAAGEDEVAAEDDAEGDSADSDAPPDPPLQ